MEELEEIITRAVVSYLMDRIMERLAAQNLFPTVPANRQSCPAATPTTVEPVSRYAGKRLLSWKDAVLCREGETLVVSRVTIVSPLAADELAKRRVTLIKE